MKKLLWVTLFCSMFALTACDRGGDKNTTESTGNGEPVAEKVDGVSHDVEKAADEAGDKVEGAAKDVEEKVKEE